MKNAVPNTYDFLSVGEPNFRYSEKIQTVVVCQSEFWAELISQICESDQLVYWQEKAQKDNSFTDLVFEVNLLTEFMILISGSNGFGLHTVKQKLTLHTVKKKGKKKDTLF